MRFEFKKRDYKTTEGDGKTTGTIKKKEKNFLNGRYKNSKHKTYKQQLMKIKEMTGNKERWDTDWNKSYKIIWKRTRI